MKEAACIFIYMWMYLENINVNLILHLQLLSNSYTDVFFDVTNFACSLQCTRQLPFYGRRQITPAYLKQHYQAPNSPIPAAAEGASWQAEPLTFSGSQATTLFQS